MRKLAALFVGTAIVLASSSLLFDVYYNFTGHFMQWVVVGSGLLFFLTGARILWAGMRTAEEDKNG